jgi:cytochrome c553
VPHRAVSAASALIYPVRTAAAWSVPDAASAGECDQIPSCRLPPANEVIEALPTMSLFLTNYMQVAALALVSTTFAIFSGCSNAVEPIPAGTGGAPAATGGVPAATGGVPAATGGVPAATGGTTGGAPIGGAGVGGTSAGAGGAGAGGMSGGAGPAGDPVAGKTVYANCSLCHGTDAVGGLGPNISGSLTAGIGAWTEAEFTRSVREAKDRTGQPLCVLMTPYTAAMMSDVQLKDLHAYLLSVKSETPNRGTGCP